MRFIVVDLKRLGNQLCLYVPGHQTWVRCIVTLALCCSDVGYPLETYHFATDNDEHCHVLYVSSFTSGKTNHSYIELHGPQPKTLVYQSTRNLRLLILFCVNSLPSSYVTLQ